MITAEFLKEFRRKTESNWSAQPVRQDIAGFQFQPGTRWNTGLSDEELNEYQRAVGFEFPNDLKLFFHEMNGTDLPTINVYANCGEPYRTSVGVYSFPRDQAVVLERIADVKENRLEVAADLAEQGFDLPKDANLMPIYSHRYVVCPSDGLTSVVLSVVVRDVDAIVYADSLKAYLEREFIVHGSRS